MSFVETVARQQAVVFDRLGEDAGWTGFAQPVRVRIRRFDGEAELGDGRLIVRRCFVLVRASEVTRPKAGDVVTPQKSGGSYTLRGDPMLNQKGVWECEAVQS